MHIYVTALYSENLLCQYDMQIYIHVYTCTYICPLNGNSVRVLILPSSFLSFPPLSTLTSTHRYPLSLLPSPPPLLPLPLPSRLSFFPLPPSPLPSLSPLLLSDSVHWWQEEDIPLFSRCAYHCSMHCICYWVSHLEIVCMCTTWWDWS